MFDDMYLYRLNNGELLVAHEIKNEGTGNIVLKGPHSIIEQEGKVMLQPSIPHEVEAEVEMSRDLVLFRTKSPQNIIDGYRQALSGIVSPKSALPDNVTPLSTGLKG